MRSQSTCRCPGPVNRREILRAGALGMFGLTWPQLLSAAEESGAGRGASFGRAKACILVYLDGGMSHIDTLDMKPDAPAEYRGEFKPIPTRVPGIHVCEHLPQVARVIHLCGQVRSMGQRGRGIIGDNHHTGAYYYLTGHVPDPSFGTLRLNRKPRPDDWPFIGSVVAMKKEPQGQVPPLVALPDKARSSNYIRAGQFGARLGPNYNPLYVRGDQTKPREFTIPSLTLPTELSLTRLGSRRELLRSLDQRYRELDSADTLLSYNKHQEKAFSLLSSTASRGAFDLSQESESVRARYSDDVNGQSMLMARRLVEAGVPIVSVFWQARRNEADRCSGWDTHRNNFHCLKTYLLPYLDVAFSALLEDLEQRGLLDTTLVVLLSEMGRKTKIGDPRDGGWNGRDHWVHCQTVVFAGAGIRRSYIFGASDRTASYPIDRPVGPEDLAATLYHALGISDLTATTPDGRRYSLLDDGEPIVSLFG